MPLRYYLRKGRHSVGNWRQVCCRQLFIVCSCSFGSSKTSKIRLKTLTQKFQFVAQCRPKRMVTYDTNGNHLHLHYTYSVYCSNKCQSAWTTYKKMQLLHFLSPVSVCVCVDWALFVRRFRWLWVNAPTTQWIENGVHCQVSGMRNERTTV